jgi:phage-related protein
MRREKPVYWVGSSYKDLLAFSDGARRDAGYQLHRVQIGLEPEDWKPFQTVGSGVREIRISETGNAFRVLYVAKFAGRIYVLHVFQKKAQKTPERDISIAKTRYNAIAREEMP